MKYISFFLIICLFILNNSKSFAEDALTIKQQLDRIMEEVKDLNKAVFNKSFNNDQLYSTNEINDTERFTSIDIRIYDLEKDIKNLTLQFEEILFKLDDLSNDVDSLELELINKLEEIKIESKKENININKSENQEDVSVKEENTLGKIVISDKNKSTNVTDSSISIEEEEKII